MIPAPTARTSRPADGRSVPWVAVAHGTTINAAERTSADGRHIRYIAARSA